MTEKRFVNKGKDIFQYGEWWCSANGEHCADVIATAINELIEENQQLKQTVSDWSGSYDELFEDVKRLEEENEQLKKSVNNLKDTIIKITIAYQRKYDKTIVDLVGEVHDEDITDLIKELQ